MPSRARWRCGWRKRWPNAPWHPLPPRCARRPPPHAGEVYSGAPHVPEKRAVKLQLALQALAIGGGDLELAERYRRHLCEIFLLDRRGEILALVHVLGQQPLLRQLLDFRIVVPAEPAGGTLATERCGDHRVDDEAAGEPGVEH